MLNRNKKIISTVVALLIGITLPTFSKVNPAFSQEEIWHYYNQQLNGGAVYQIFTDNQTGTSLFCSVNKTAMYTKKQGNDVWEKISLPQSNTYIQYIYPFASSFILVADQGMYLYHGEYNDQGIWDVIDAPKINKTIEIIKTTHQDTAIYWYATSAGLFYSFEAGAENPEKLLIWHLSNFNTGIEIKDLWFEQTDNTLYVLSSDGWLYKTEEPQRVTTLKWDRIQLDTQIHSVQQFMITQDQQKIWIISTQSQGLFLSKNYGLNWENISKTLPNLYVSQMFQYQDEVYTATYGGLYAYHLSRQLWRKIGSSLINEHVNCFTIQEMNRKIIIGTNGNGVWSIQDEENIASWQKDDQKIEGVLVKKLIKNQQENKMMVSTWGAGIYITNNDGISWKQSNQGLTNPYILSLYYESDEKIWAGTFNGGLFLSRDFGESWKQITSPTLLSKYIYSIVVDRNNSNVIYIGTNRTVFKSNNQGESWNTLDLGTEDRPVGNILALEQDLVNPEMIYAGTDSSGIYLSKDGGQSWFPSQNGLTFKTINQIKAIPYKTNLIIAATNGDGCYMTTNQGNTWKKIEGSSNHPIVYDIMYTNDKPHLEDCFVSTETGLLQLDFTQFNWKTIGATLNQTSIRSSLFYQKQLWAGTYGKGVARLITLPSPPIPMDPPNRAEITKTRIMFRWSESSFSEYPVLYKVQLSIDQDFKTIFYSSNTISGDQWLIPENTLQKHQTYYWRVRGETILGSTEWSKSYQFTIVTIIQMQINQSEIQINGQKQTLDPNPKVVPVIQNNRTFLPIRVVVEAWGGTIAWDNTLKKVDIQLKENTIQLTIQNPIALVNGNPKQIDENKGVVPFILNGRTMLPLRFIAENLQAQVEWNPATQSITLIYPMRRES